MVPLRPGGVGLWRRWLVPVRWRHSPRAWLRLLHGGRSWHRLLLRRRLSLDRLRYWLLRRQWRRLGGLLRYRLRDRLWRLPWSLLLHCLRGWLWRLLHPFALQALPVRLSPRGRRSLSVWLRCCLGCLLLRGRRCDLLLRVLLWQWRRRHHRRHARRNHRKARRQACRCCPCLQLLGLGELRNRPLLQGRLLLRDRLPRLHLRLWRLLLFRQWRR